MTREEAIAAISRELATMIYDPRLAERYGALDDALMTLAPAVRYEPPTDDDAKAYTKAWVCYYAGGKWELVTMDELRAGFGEYSPYYVGWLPPTAIPEGGA